MSKFDVQVGDKVRIDGIVSRFACDGSIIFINNDNKSNTETCLYIRDVTTVLERPIRVGSMVAYKSARGYETRG